MNINKHQTDRVYIWASCRKKETTKQKLQKHGERGEERHISAVFDVVRTAAWVVGGAGPWRRSWIQRGIQVVQGEEIQEEFQCMTQKFVSILTFRALSRNIKEVHLLAPSDTDEFLHYWQKKNSFHHTNLLWIMPVSDSTRSHFSLTLCVVLEALTYLCLLQYAFPFQKLYNFLSWTKSRIYSSRKAETTATKKEDGPTLQLRMLRSLLIWEWSSIFTMQLISNAAIVMLIAADVQMSSQVHWGVVY